MALEEIGAVIRGHTINPDFRAESANSLISRLSEWSLPKVLRERAARQGEAPALQFEQGEEISYSELVRRSENLAANLLLMGVEKGDRVALIMENSAEMVIAWFAINFIGAVEVPVNIALRGSFLSHVLNNSSPKILIVDSLLTKDLLAIRDEVSHVQELVLNGPTQSDMPWPHRQLSDLIKTASASDIKAVRSIDVSYDDPAAIMYTSGTTGPAKGVLLPHGQMFIWAMQMIEALRLMKHDVFYVVLPMFHGNAQIMQVYAAMAAGSKVVLYKRFSTSRWVQQVTDSGATVSSLLGVMAQFIFDGEPTERDAKIPISRMITIPMPAAIGDSFRKRFKLEYLEAFGMTEVCLPLMDRLGEEKRPGSCGLPLNDWFEVAVIDPKTDVPVPPDTVGEIVVRPKHPWIMMSRYFGMEDRTVKAWRNLWFHTGDSGKYDEDGYYYFADRLQDRIRRRGENVSSYELEAAASEYDNVLEAAAVAVPAEEGDDEIKLCVVTKDGNLNFLEFLEHCKARMAYFAVPRYFHVFSEFPKTPNGKVLKRELRDSDGISNWDRVSAGIHIRRDS